MLEAVERWIRWTGAAAGLACLIFILWQGTWRGLRRPAGRTTGSGGKLLRAPVLGLIGLLWIGACAILWRPLPVQLSSSARILLLIAGILLYFPGLAIYLWGAITLREMYRPSSLLGVQLDAGHKLITHGPYSRVRHPRYLGLQMAAIGGLLLFRTWTFVFIVTSFITLIFRAWREESALELEFGEGWRSYCQRVPAWIPRIRQPNDPGEG